MGRIKEFRFLWTDAWHNIEDGYDTIIETADSGSVILQCLVNGKKQSIDLTDREDRCIEALENCHIKSWNHKNFNNFDWLDGDQWELHIAYDNFSIHSSGMNGYPAEFGQFLDFLVEELGLEESYFCRRVRANLKQARKGTMIEKMSNWELTSPTYK